MLYEVVRSEFYFFHVPGFAVIDNFLYRAHFVHALLADLFKSISESRSATNLAAVALLYDIGCSFEKGIIKVR